MLSPSLVAATSVWLWPSPAEVALSRKLCGLIITLLIEEALPTLALAILGLLSGKIEGMGQVSNCDFRLPMSSIILILN